jgi:sugar phosphate isomerase/epimerase
VSVELGIFARTFTRTAAADVAEAVAGAGFTLTQFNLSSIGLPTLPPVDATVDLAAISAAFNAVGVRIWGLSATYNVVHPDLAVRQAGTTRAKVLIRRARELGADVVTLCSGSRDTQDMWRAHPDNATQDAWRDLRSTLDELLPAAEQAGVVLGIEPEPGNVVSDAAHGARLLDELGPDAKLVGIILDAANLVSPSTLDDQEQILRNAFAVLGPHTVALHAKDVVRGGGFSAAGRGDLDYPLIFDLHATLPAPVPVIIQDAEEDDVGRTREFLLRCSVGREPRQPSKG